MKFAFRLPAATCAVLRNGVIAVALLLPIKVPAIVGPASDRAFSPHPVSGDTILAQMTNETANPHLATVVYLGNSDPNAQFGTWTGTLISSNWILTCAHALQGTDGRGAGISAANLTWYSPGLPFTETGQEEIAEFLVHTNWQYEGYTNGYDIALLRLAVPVTQAVVYPRLSAEDFVGQRGVVIAGYGEQGDGITGGNGVSGQLAVGVNSLDDVGGKVFLRGNGQNYTAFTNWANTVAFMDFDKSERRHFLCGTYPGFDLDVVLTSFSTMGFEREGTAAVQDPCAANNPVIAGVFGSPYCDFLPGAGDSGGPAFLWPTAPNIPPYGYYLSAPATLFGVASYRASGGQTNAQSVYGNITAFTLVESHLGWIFSNVRELADADTDGDGQTDEQEWLAGSAPYAVVAANPATLVRNPVDIQLANSRILAERAVDAGHTEVEFAADLLNEDSGRYRDLSLSVIPSNLPPSAIIVDGRLDFLTLPESGNAGATPGEVLIVRVANAELNALRQTLLDGTAFDLSAYEEQVFIGPSRYVDEPTDQAFDWIDFDALHRLVLIFDYSTALLELLRPGDLLVANGYPGGYRPAEPSPTDQFAIPYLSQQLPFEVEAVNTVDGKIHVAGYKRDLNEILKSGTFIASDENFNGSRRDLLDPPVENTYTEEEKEERSLQARLIQETDPGNSGLADIGGMNAIPWRFNELKITDHLQLSGQVLLRSSGLRFQVTFRDFEIKRASVGIDAGVVGNLLVETTGTNHNLGAPIAEKQVELATIPLPGIPVTIAGVPCAIAPSFVLSVGAEASAPAGLSIPFETSATIGTEIGWADGQTFANPIKEFSAPHVSDPAVFDAVAASARAWVEARLNVDLSVAGGIAKAGPSLAVVAEAGFEVAPFNDPWWTLDIGADLIGRFEMDLLGFNVAGVEATEDIATFLHRDAGGPLLSPAAPQNGPQHGPNPLPEDLLPKAGRNTRWALAFAAPNASANYSKAFVAPLAGGGYMVGGGAAIPSFLGNISADGHMLWTQNFPQGPKPVDGFQLADGSVMVAGVAGLDWWLAKYETNGNRTWCTSHRIYADLRKLALKETPGGDPEFYLAGFQNPVVVTQSDPVVVKLDKDGNLVWSKVYVLDDDDEVFGMRLLRDGNLLLVGRTDSRVGEDLFIGAGNNGLLAKISPDGDVLWAKAVPGRWGMQFHDAAETEDGTILVVGAHGDIIRDYYPGIFAGRFSPQGELIHHVLIGEDPDWEDALPDGGDTPYDLASQAMWTGDSLVVVGTTGLGGTISGWAASLTDELGVRWFSAFDGPGGSGLSDLAITADGIAALGWADEIWPTKYDNRTPAWLLMLPWEGMLRFHPNTGARSAFLQPHVFLSSVHTDFVGRITDDQQHVHLVPTADVPFVVSNSFPVLGAQVYPGVPLDFVTARLERLEPSLLDSYDDWAAYNQLDGTNSVPTGDWDGDGNENGSEFFFGTNPLIEETNQPPSLVIAYDTTNSVVAIDFNRAQAAASQPYTLQYSTNLSTWLPTLGTTEHLLGSEQLYDKLRLLLPAPAPEAANFRLEIPSQ